MVGHLRNWLVTAGVIWAVSATPVSAGWLCFRNDSKQPVVVQTSTIATGPERTRPGIKTTVRKSIPHTLHPGELMRDWIADHSVKQVVISEPGRSPTVLHRFDTPKMPSDGLSYAIESVKKPDKKTPVVSVVKIDKRPRVVSKK